MARTVTLTNGDNTFVQGFGAANISVTVNALGGRDTIRLDRDDDQGGRNTVNAGDGDDAVVNLKEDGSLISLGLGNDTYVGLGFGSFSFELGDLVSGGAGNDLFSFSTFKSTYRGDDGNDTFFSTGQRNRIEGGAGIDTVSYRTRDSDDGGVFINLTTRQVETGPIAIETLSSIENAEGSAQGDQIAGNGFANRLTGGGGVDELEGRGGADVFVYRAVTDAPVFSDVADEIFDFSRAQGDRIDLRSIDADASVAGNQAFLFRGATAFSGDQRQLRVQDLGDGRCVVQGDRTGDGVADFQILLNGISSLLGTDFFL